MQANRPAIVAFQPVPAIVKVIYDLTPDRPQTVIIRGWRDGEGKHCRLCPRDRCNVEGDVCGVMVEGLVPEAECELYRLPAGLADRIDVVFADRPGHPT